MTLKRWREKFEKAQEEKAMVDGGEKCEVVQQLVFFLNTIQHRDGFINLFFLSPFSQFSSFFSYLSLLFGLFSFFLSFDDIQGW